MPSATKVLALVALATTPLPAQPQPTNSLANPYETIVGWAKLTEGRTWGSLSAIDVDRDGVSVWVAERCGANTCAGSKLASIMKFDSTGRMVRSFGEGILV